MRILIAGAGYVGLRLAQLLRGQHEVFALRRSWRGPAPTGIQTIAADLTDPESLRDLPAVDGVAVTVSSDERSEDGYERAYVASINHLRRQLEGEANRPKRWVFTSSTAVYGDTDGRFVDEESSTEPEGFAGRTLLRAERLFLDAPWESVVLRLGGIYGPGRTRLLDQVRTGDATIPNEPTYTNRIHRDDAARALAHLLTLPDPAPIYLGVDDDPAERGEVLRWLATQLDAPPPPSSDRARTRGNKRCSNTRLRESGFDFTFPTFREGYASMLHGPERPSDA